MLQTQVSTGSKKYFVDCTVLTTIQINTDIVQDIKAKRIHTNSLWIEVQTTIILFKDIKGKAINTQYSSANYVLKTKRLKKTNL